jgi:MarR family transcriptional regulator, organic hydroperoxide resistance regulator
MNEKVSHLLGHHITSAARSMQRALQRGFRQAGYPITAEQWIVLVCLYDHDGRTQQELCELTFKEKPSLTRILNNLEISKFVTRMSDPEDGRTNRVFLTKYCKKIETELLKIAEEVQVKALQEIATTDIEITRRTLQKIMKNVD